MTNPDSAMAAARECLKLCGMDTEAWAEIYAADWAAIIRKHQAQELTDLQASDESLMRAADELSRRLTEQAQEIAELVAGLRQARNYFIGLSAYLATCNTDVIIENLETTIAALHREERKVESLLSRYPKV